MTIESDRSDGTQFVRKYRFTDCKIEAGRVSHISIDYLHPENQDGSLYVRKEDFFRFRADTMFLASEPREVFMTVAVVLFMRMLRCRFPFQTNISCLSSSFLL